MAAVDLSAFLQNGQTYTLTFEPTGMLSYLEHPDVGALNASVQALPNIAGASVSVSVPAQLGGTDYYSVTFYYVGDGSDALAVIVQEILDAFSQATSVGWNFVGANAGGAGVTQQNQSTSGSLGSLQLFPSGSSMWALVLLVFVFVFLFYGGGGLVKKGISAAS